MTEETKKPAEAPEVETQAAPQSGPVPAPSL